MQVIGSKTDPVPLQAPAMCIICEHSPMQDAGERVIDTERTFIPQGPPTRLNGRKYVCDNCVKEMGRLIGMEFSSESKRLQGELDVARTEIARVKSRVQDFARDVEHVATLIPDVAYAPSEDEPPEAQRPAPTEDREAPSVGVAASSGEETTAESIEDESNEKFDTPEAFFASLERDEETPKEEK